MCDEATVPAPKKLRFRLNSAATGTMIGFGAPDRASGLVAEFILKCSIFELTIFLTAEVWRTFPFLLTCSLRSDFLISSDLANDITPYFR